MQPLRAATLCLLAACRSPSVADQAPAPGPSVAVSVSPSTAPAPSATDDRRLLVEASQAEHFFFAARPRPGQTFFTPTAADISAFEVALTPALRTKSPPTRPGTRPLADRWPTYFRQYVGHVEPDGSRWIWGNFFCHDHHDDSNAWRKQGVFAKDGGDCYFQVDFSPMTHELRNLSINGEG